MSAELEARVAALEAQVAQLLNARPGRKRRPILVSAEGVCALDPDTDSSSCPHATLYRKRMGCKGIACEQAAKVYYAEYRGTVAAPSESE